MNTPCDGKRVIRESRMLLQHSPGFLNHAVEIGPFFLSRVTVSFSWSLGLRVGNLGSGAAMEVDRGHELIQAEEIAGFAVLGVVRWQASPTTYRDSMQYHLFTACLFS